MMTANELINNLIEKINSEFTSIMSEPENESLIGDEISSEMDTVNCFNQAQEYLTAINILLEDGKSLPIFLKKILIVISKMENIEDDFNIDKNFEVLGVNNDLLQNIYIDNEEINNLYLDQNKIILISGSYNSFNDFIEDFINEEGSSREMLFILKALYDNFDFTLESGMNKIMFLANCTSGDIKNYNVNKNELTSYLKLSILSEGLTFHKHHPLNNSIVSQTLACDSTKEYAQYNEILYILSEYNYSNDLLNKYFLLYTIIENFMYRKPIAQMLRSTQEFSIRDFKRFYSKIDSNEGQKIDHLFKSILDIDFHGQIFLDLIKADCEDFFNKPDIKEDNLISFLLKIGVSNKNGELDKSKYFGNFSSNFAKTIYQLRNSILHNTATEFHITHYELSKNSIIVEYLREFIIPNLEKIILHLIFSNHELISYENKSLLLYG